MSLNFATPIDLGNTRVANMGGGPSMLPIKEDMIHFHEPQGHNSLDNDLYTDLLDQVFEENVLQSLENNGSTRVFALTAYGSIYSRVSGEMQRIIKDIDRIKNHYIAEAIVQQIVSDVLAPKVGTDDIIRYSSSDPKIQNELDELKKRIGLDQLLNNITPDLIRYGSYTLENIIDIIPSNLKNKKSGKGILDVTDVVEPGTVIPMTQDGRVEGFIVMDELTQRIEMKDIADFTHFSLGGERVRVDIRKMIPVHLYHNNKKLKKLIRKLPRFLRVGRSVLYPVIGKIKELELIEKLIPATKLNKMTQGNLIGLPVDEKSSLKAALKASRRIEGMLNRKTTVDAASGEISIEAILSAAGRNRVVPLLGDKGRLERLDTKLDEPDDLLSSVVDLRSTILDSIGVPSELIYKSEGDSKAEILKRNAKYLGKLKNVRKTLSEGAKHIAYIHLANRNIDFKEEDIDVHFMNPLIEIENLDKLEFADTTISSLDNLLSFIRSMSEEDSPFKDSLDLNKAAKYFDEQLSTFGLSDLFQLDTEGGADTNDVQDDIETQGLNTEEEGDPTDENRIKGIRENKYKKQPKPKKRRRRKAS